MDPIPLDPGRRGTVAIILRPIPGSPADSGRSECSVSNPQGEDESNGSASSGRSTRPWWFRHQFLVIRRSRWVVAPRAYCFPGGAIEPDESESEALVRELREELHAEVRPVRCVWHSITPWQVRLAWWLSTLAPEAALEPNPAEVESVHWLTAEAMLELPELLESNRQFLTVLATGQIDLQH